MQYFFRSAMRLVPLLLDPCQSSWQLKYLLPSLVIFNFDVKDRARSHPQESWLLLLAHRWKSQLAGVGELVIASCEPWQPTLR